MISALHFRGEKSKHLNQMSSKNDSFVSEIAITFQKLARYLLLLFRIPARLLITFFFCFVYYKLM